MSSIRRKAVKPIQRVESDSDSSTSDDDSISVISSVVSVASIPPVVVINTLKQCDISDDDDDVSHVRIIVRKGVQSNLVKIMTIAQARTAIDRSHDYYEELAITNGILTKCPSAGDLILYMVPYFDFDYKFESQESLKGFSRIGEKLIRQCFNKVFAGCQLYCKSSHGQTKENDWKFSYHVIVRGAGRHKSGADICKKYADLVDNALAKLVTADKQLDWLENFTCDRTVYKKEGSQQLFRTIGSTKPGENRKAKPDRDVGDDIDYAKYFITYTDGEDDVDPEPSIITARSDDDRYWDLIGNDGIYKNTTGEKRSLSLAQIKTAIENLKHSRFADYNMWCKLLWGCARWADENSVEEELMIDILDDFSSKCDNYDCRRNVEKKYNEAMKRSSSADKTTIGTVLMWLKEDSPETLTQIFKEQKREELAVITRDYNGFDSTDNYVWGDFERTHNGGLFVFKSYATMIDSVKKNISRVLVLIQSGDGYYRKKDTLTDWSYVKELKGASTNFYLKYENEVINKKTNKKSSEQLKITLKELLLNERLCMVFTHEDIYPNRDLCPNGCLNLWGGFVAKKVDSVSSKLDDPSVETICWILKNIWAAGDEKIYKWLLGWFHLTLANPEEMCKTAIFVTGKPGSGKSIVVDWMYRYIFGPRCASIFNGMREFEDKHNVEIKGRKLIYINEMCPVGEKSSIIASDFDRMKAFITDPIIKERGMYREAITFKNYSNVIMCSNHPTSIKIETNDRRYVCLETSDIKCNKPGESTHNRYWESVHKEIDNQAYADNFYSWLISLDSKELGNPRIPINTELKQSIAEVNECNVFSFYKHVKERREEAIFEDMESAGLESTEEPLTCQVEYKAIELYNMYREWCTDEGISYQIKSNKFFSIAMKKFMAWKKKKDAAYWYFLEDQSSEKVEEIPPIGLSKLDLSVIAGSVSSVQLRDDNLLN